MLLLQNTHTSYGIEGQKVVQTSACHQFHPMINGWGSKQQQQYNDVLLPEFRTGAMAVLRLWSALRTAVESGWGGRTPQ